MKTTEIDLSLEKITEIIEQLDNSAVKNPEEVLKVLIAGCRSGAAEVRLESLRALVRCTSELYSHLPPFLKDILSVN